MSKIFLQPPDHRSLDEFLTCAKQGGYNLEIACFADPNVLDGNWREVLEDHRRKLRHFEGTISLHGPFLGLYIHSRDSKIRAVARERIVQGMEIAKRLGAKYVVFHGNFIPLIGRESYEKNWIAQNAHFWSEILEKYDVTVLLENLWEPGPELFREVLEKVSSPRLKICFDTGHASVFSKVPFEEWVSVLGDGIAYVHVNDNDGEVDDELAPGEGNINWREFSDLIEKHRTAPNIVFEVGTLEKTIRSIGYFEGNKIYPFNESGQKRRNWQSNTNP
jgi:sugar phosphate isomerase/epimerase